MKYKLLKKAHATDEFTVFGIYDTSDLRELEAMTRAVFDFGRWMYVDFRIEEVKDDAAG